MPCFNAVVAAMAVVASICFAGVIEEPAGRPHTLPHPILIKSIVKGEPKNEKSGLYAQLVHSGAGLNDITMVQIEDSTNFRYNTTNQVFYAVLGRKETIDTTNYFGLSNFGTQNARLRSSYKTVTANLGSMKDSQKFSLDLKTKAFKAVSPPSDFKSFAVCNVHLISGDEPKSSYQQLTYRTKEKQRGCADVDLFYTNYFGGD